MCFEGGELGQYKLRECFCSGNLWSSHFCYLRLKEFRIFCLTTLIDCFFKHVIQIFVKVNCSFKIFYDIVSVIKYFYSQLLCIIALANDLYLCLRFKTLKCCLGLKYFLFGMISSYISVVIGTVHIPIFISKAYGFNMLLNRLKQLTLKLLKVVLLKDINCYI